MPEGSAKDVELAVAAAAKAAWMAAGRALGRRARWLHSSCPWTTCASSPGPLARWMGVLQPSIYLALGRLPPTWLVVVMMMAPIPVVLEQHQTTLACGELALFFFFPRRARATGKAVMAAPGCWCANVFDDADIEAAAQGAVCAGFVDAAARAAACSSIRWPLRPLHGSLPDCRRGSRRGGGGCESWSPLSARRASYPPVAARWRWWCPRRAGAILAIWPWRATLFGGDLCSAP